ncbi:MAG: HAMP domain-containing protein [Uliginosibacterium sp.]|nr:HAMP domain-containing protein [Uliginosibacterium sp.]
MRMLVVRVQAQLGSYTRFTQSLHGQQGFFVSFRVDEDDPEDEYWLMLPPNRVTRLGVAEWLGWGSLAVLMSLLGAYLLVRGVTRPLKALENTARAIGRGEPHAPLPEHGPREISEVAKAFNQMSHDLAQLESDRALILAGVSHDLRTPLARLRLGIELSGAPEEELAAMSADIEDMDRIIRQFLDFARDASAEAVQEADLADIVRRAIQPLLLRDAPLRLEGLSPCLAPRLRVNALQRAVANLVDNALKYGGPAPRSTSAPGETATTCISKWPIAGQASRLSRPSDSSAPSPAWKTHEATSRDRGLGLAIVDRIARMHDGALLLQPREGGGLRAIIKLPGH